LKYNLKTKATNLVMTLIVWPDLNPDLNIYLALIYKMELFLIKLPVKKNLGYLCWKTSQKILISCYFGFPFCEVTKKLWMSFYRRLKENSSPNSCVNKFIFHIKLKQIPLGQQK
jgi:hypothetical protein